MAASGMSSNIAEDKARIGNLWFSKYCWATAPINPYRQPCWSKLMGVKAYLYKHLRHIQIQWTWVLLKIPENCSLARVPTTFRWRAQGPSTEFTVPRGTRELELLSIQFYNYSRDVPKRRNEQSQLQRSMLILGKVKWGTGRRHSE